MLYSGAEILVKIFFKLQLGRVEGLENLPPPPCIMAVNHVSPYDPQLIVLQLYPWLKKYNKKIAFLTNRKVIALFAPFHKFLGMFPGTKEGLTKALDYIHQGIPIGIFPNRDRRSKTMKRFHLGPVYLSAKTHVPIVPIGIKTKEEVYPSWNISKAIKNFFYKKHIIIGQPFFVEQGTSLIKATEELTLKVAGLINKEVSRPQFINNQLKKTHKI
jgi:1-acyl-sn-glycerol-3-phosphate acyltransferase